MNCWVCGEPVSAHTPDPLQVAGSRVWRGCPDQERVDCDNYCGAFENPHTLEEYKEALEHWMSHSYLSGCSHAC